MSIFNFTLKSLLLSSLLFILCPSASFAQKYLDMIGDGNYTFDQISLEAELYFDTAGTDKGSGFKQWQRWKYHAQHSLDEHGFVIDGLRLYKLSVDYNREFNAQLTGRGSFCSGDWQPLGPLSVKGAADYDPGIGRITSAAIDPNDALHILVGAETGGVWKTLDGGETWSPLSDDLSTLDVSSLAIDPENPEIYYWGVAWGLIFKSTNAGLTWQEIEFDGGGTVEKILINPLQTTELWLTDHQSGIFHSTDAGETWSPLIEEGCSDIELHPTNPNILYAAGNSLWKSVDGGVTFQSLPFPYQNNRPKFIDVSDAAPGHLYVLQSIGSRFEGLYISRNEGDDFSRLYNSDKNLLGYDHLGRDPAGQAPRNMDIAVSDTDTSLLFVAGINVWRSLDAGIDFYAVSFYSYNHPFDDKAYCHADIETLIIHNEQLFIGSDGGFYLMEDMTNPVINYHSIKDLSNGLNIRQLYRIGLADRQEEIISLGAQDNGTALYYQGLWKYYYIGDGTETFIVDGPSGLLLFASLQYGVLAISEDTAQTAQPLPGTYSMHGSGKWVTPFEKDPNDPMTIYAGYDKVYRSGDLGKTIEPISHVFHPSVISIAPTGSDTIYSGSATNVYRTTDGGLTEWDRILYNNLNHGQIADIAVHPRNANLVAVAAGGPTNVWLTRDGGDNWEAWDQDLAPVPALSLVWQDSDLESLYLGTSIGIFYRDKTMDGWVPFQFGMPVVKVNELEINEKSGKIYAATYGRGIWVSPLCNLTSGIITAARENDIKISPNPVRPGQRVSVDLPTGTTAELLVFDQSGRIVGKAVKTEEVNSDFHFKAPDLQGTYFVRVQSKQGMAIAKCIVLE